MRILTIIFAILAFCASTLYSQGVSSLSTEAENVKVLDLLNKIRTAEKISDHCEVPCGIYNDSLRVSLLREHSATIEKAMNQINEQSKSGTPNYNQLVRWINNKESHAEEIQKIASQYFLHQRVKMPKKDLPKGKIIEAKEKYFNLLSSLHAIQVYAMKSKQTTDLGQIKLLNTAISDFESYYFHGHKH